jgi:bifunctional DNA-binding transcriptional regulator/antitoxin component of YhaV-PrlF toxin-antitoxin module
MAQKQAIIGKHGEITVPSELQERYQLCPDAPVRLVETRVGILIVPLTSAPLSEEMLRELAAWQSVGLQSWEQFPYEEAEP